MILIFGEDYFLSFCLELNPARKFLSLETNIRKLTLFVLQGQLINKFTIIKNEFAFRGTVFSQFLPRVLDIS